MKKRVSIIFIVLLVFVSAASAYLFGGTGQPANWPSKLGGEGEFMIYLRSDLSSSLVKIEITIEKVTGTVLYSGTTLVCDNGNYSVDDPFSCTDYLTLTPIHYVKEGTIPVGQINGATSELIGHVGHSYDSLVSGSSSRPYMLGYGTYKISMKFYHTLSSYTNQRWYVDLQDPNYPYDTHGHPDYYDIGFCVNPGNGNDYSASAYLTTANWNSWVLISPNGTGNLSNAFSSCLYHRTFDLGLGSGSFQNVPLTVSISGPSVLYIYTDIPFSSDEPVYTTNALSSSATGTYHASVECGLQQAQYNYQWQLTKPGWTTWISAGTGESVTITQNGDFYLKCTASYGSETATTTKFVDVVYR